MKDVFYCNDLRKVPTKRRKRRWRTEEQAGISRVDRRRFYPLSTSAFLSTLFEVGNEGVIEHFGIDLSGLDRRMPQQSLNGGDGYTLAKQ